MSTKPAICSSEIGILWMTYQQKTMLLTMLEYFINKSEDHEAKDIMQDLVKEIKPYVEKMKDIFQKEGIPVPIGFNEKDVNKDVPSLYENGFDILFLRLIKEISMGMHTLNLTMAYREDIIKLFRELTITTQSYYSRCTHYLLKKGLLSRAPFVDVIDTLEFVQNKDYLGGINPLKEKRPLTTVEIAHIYHAIESNIIGMKMIFGFAQCAKDSEVSKYFRKGGELAKEMINDLSSIMEESDLSVPATAGGNYTTSKVPPFSDKLMMYCISLFCSFSLGGNSLGTAFSLRNDIPAKLSIFMKDIFEYAHEGAKIMISHGFMEEPPQMEKHPNN